MGDTVVDIITGKPDLCRKLASGHKESMETPQIFAFLGQTFSLYDFNNGMVYIQRIVADERFHALKWTDLIQDTAFLLGHTAMQRKVVCGRIILLVSDKTESPLRTLLNYTPSVLAMSQALTFAHHLQVIVVREKPQFDPAIIQSYSDALMSLYASNLQCEKVRVANSLSPQRFLLKEGKTMIKRALTESSRAYASHKRIKMGNSELRTLNKVATMSSVVSPGSSRASLDASNNSERWANAFRGTESSLGVSGEQLAPGFNVEVFGVASTQAVSGEFKIDTSRQSASEEQLVDQKPTGSQRSL